MKRERNQRVVVYVPAELRAKLKAALAMERTTVSAWFRRQAEALVSRKRRKT